MIFERILGSEIFNIFDVKNAVVQATDVNYYGVLSTMTDELSDGCLFSLSNSQLTATNVYLHELKQVGYPLLVR